MKSNLVRTFVMLAMAVMLALSSADFASAGSSSITPRSGDHIGLTEGGDVDTGNGENNDHDSGNGEDDGDVGNGDTGGDTDNGEDDGQTPGNGDDDQNGDTGDDGDNGNGDTGNGDDNGDTGDDNDGDVEDGFPVTIDVWLEWRDEPYVCHRVTYTFTSIEDGIEKGFYLSENGEIIDLTPGMYRGAKFCDDENPNPGDNGQTPDEGFPVKVNVCVVYNDEPDVAHWHMGTFNSAEELASAGLALNSATGNIDLTEDAKTKARFCNEDEMVDEPGDGNGETPGGDEGDGQTPGNGDGDQNGDGNTDDGQTPGNGGDTGNGDGDGDNGQIPGNGDGDQNGDTGNGDDGQTPGTGDTGNGDDDGITGGESDENVDEQPVAPAASEASAQAGATDLPVTGVGQFAKGNDPVPAMLLAGGALALIALAISVRQREYMRA